MTNKDNYLWDKSQPKDSEIQQLEQTLSVLRYQGESTNQVHRWMHIRLAVAASIILAIGVWLFVTQPMDSSIPGWDVVAITGTTTIDSMPLNKAGQLRLGQWLETDKNSTAKVSVSSIGDVTVYPNSRLGLLVSMEQKEHRLKLDHGKIKAFITAPPKLFFVETSSALAVDYGCEYILEIDEKGDGKLEVILGWVALERDGRQSFVPMDGSCKIQADIGPGTPYFNDATQSFLDALNELDFNGGGDKAIRTVLEEARPRDTLTLWHLLWRDNKKHRAATYARMKFMDIPMPESVTRKGIVALDKDMMDDWWNKLKLSW